MADIDNPSRPSPLTITRNDYILLFVENLSLSDITLGGLVFIALFIVTYFLLIVWACVKDKQKQVYSQRVASGQNHSQISLAMPRRANFRAVNIDITSDTLDFTNQSVRVNFEDQRDLSTLFQNTHHDGHATISPMHRTDQMSVSPHPNDKRIKFNMVRTPHRGPQKIDLETTGGPPSSTGGDDEPVTAKEEIITKEDTIKDDGTLAKEISNMMEDMCREDEFVQYKSSAKKESKKRVKERSSSIKVTNKVRQGVKSKFMKLMGQRHVILSTVQRMSRISPRYKRVSLLAFLLSCDLFAMSLTFIDLSIFNGVGIKILEIIKMSICTWILFAAISWLSSVSKDTLKNTKSNDDFMRVLAALEKEAHYKDIAVHIIIGIFVLCSLTQFGLFFTVKGEYILWWLLCSLTVFLIQIVLFDSLWLLVIAFIYIKAYDSQKIRRLYRNLNSFRFWKI